MRRAAAPARRPPLGARRPATRNQNPVRMHRAWQSGRVASHSTRDLPSHSRRKRATTLSGNGGWTKPNTTSGGRRAPSRGAARQKHGSQNARPSGLRGYRGSRATAERGAVVQDHHVLPRKKGWSSLTFSRFRWSTGGSGRSGLRRADPRVFFIVSRSRCQLLPTWMRTLVPCASIHSISPRARASPCRPDLTADGRGTARERPATALRGPGGPQLLDSSPDGRDAPAAWRAPVTA